MRKLFFLFVLISISGYGQKMAITIDDAPFGASGSMTETEKVEAFKELLATLDRFEVKATFFVTTSNLSDTTESILSMALEAGHQIGNHTHNHLNLNNVSAEEYCVDIKVCADRAAKWINSKYFRYSYLRRGNTREKRDRVFRFLKENDLVIAPVTIDNAEWEFNRDYFSAKNRNQKLTVADAYLRHMSEMTEKYRSMGVDLMGREVSHILLIHVNPINCEYLDELLSMYKEGGWQFIPLDEAMKDPIYQTKDDWIGEQGISVLDRIRLSK